MFGRLKVVGGGVLAVSALVALVAWYVNPEGAAAQTQKQVEYPSAHKNAPVVVTKVTLGNLVVQRGRFIKLRAAEDPITPFHADDNWGQNLTVYFLNRTDKIIVFMNVSFSFPETTVRRDGSIFRSFFPVTLGRIPAAALFDARGRPMEDQMGAQPITFQPGQTIAIHLGGYIGQIKEHVEPVLPLAAASQINVNFHEVFFADGMKGEGNGYTVFDPQKSAWSRMDSGYFPGDMDRYWPGRPGWPDQQ
jgi:hypothetical protein